MFNWKFVFYVMSVLMIVESFFLIISSVVALLYGEGDFICFVQSAGISLFFGGIIYLFTQNCSRDIGKREAFLVVSLVWVVFSIFGALPFLLGGYIPNFTDAFFESISGFTTTGASIVNDIEALPHGILFWRSLTHLLGGMGILVLTVAILPVFGIGGMAMFNAEAAGITMGKLHPRIKETAQRLWGIYMLLVAIETIFLVFGEMDWFDAICHSFGTLASGGFSTKNTSIVNYSPYTQYVLIVFMFFAGVNFTLHYFAIKGRFRKIWQNQEFKVYTGLIVLVTSIITLTLVYLDHGTFEKSFRDALFQVTSIITSTGFVSADYSLWHPYLVFLIFGLMFTGACVGSTSGGVKILRHLLLFKNSILEFKRMIHPSAVLPVRYNKEMVGQDVISKILAFVILYFMVFFIGCFAMTLIGLDLISAMGAVATTMGGIGPGLGVVGPMNNFASVPEVGKWILSFLMILGRLELFTFLIIFVPSFWKNQ
ncbi:TrkH family potassium uptake protein [Labilibaculum antarcticum]|uniref:Potassium transporter n=1 Tax=Labilibaculum antarcticum TaxID=1717717 RepID=A0A1Y1CNN8_9BACT|nr:potassium transporter TrkG [Labilibaculum antarcticum]BAX80871.1 potassium transporter [Labilibaculum antarcticum]